MLTLLAQSDFDYGLGSNYSGSLDAAGGQAYFGDIISLAAVLAGLFVLFYCLRYFGRKLYNRFNPFDMLTLRVLLPKESWAMEERGEGRDHRLLIAPLESFMANLAGLRAERGLVAWFLGRRDHFSFEIVAHQGVVSFYISLPQTLREFVEQQIQAQYPDSVIEEREDYNLFTPRSAVAGSILRFKRSYLFPIRTYEDLEADPLNALTNALSKFQAPTTPRSPQATQDPSSQPEAGAAGRRGDYEGGAAIQFVVRSAHPRWHAAGNNLAREISQGKKLADAVRSANGSLFGKVWSGVFAKNKADEPGQFRGLTPYEEEAVGRVQAKSAKSGFEANIRVIVAANSEARAESQLSGIVNAFAQYAGHEYANSFRAKKPRRLVKFVNDFIYRNFNEKTSLILNTEEMVSLFHLPLPTTETPNILWLTAKQAGTPVNMPSEGLILGHNDYRGRDTVVRIKEDDRRRHVYMIGKSGSGKSALLSNMIKQDVEAGHGVGLIDPHGDLAEAVLASVPDNRRADVVYFDPSDTDWPMGLNMLEYKEDGQKDFVVQEMIAIFMKLFPPEVIGPMFEHNMRNVMLTLMADKEHPGTIVDIPRMFTDPEYQKYKISKLNDPNVRSFWEQEMAKTSDFHKSEMLGYLISKVGRFVENEMMRNIIGQPRSAFDFREVMDNKKILIVNLAKGKTGEVNSALIGLIIVAKLQMAAMSRADLPESARNDFYLYIDEFQNFVTDSIATILSEARKYRLDLTIAHQYIGQLVGENGSTQIRDAIFGNAGTIVSFKIGVEDAETIAKEFNPVFSEYDVINIPQFNAYVKLLIDNTAARPFQMKTYPPPPGEPGRIAELKAMARQKYGVARAEIESDIINRMKLGKAEAAAPLAGESLR